jgi:GWxTD domain-containing protein
VAALAALLFLGGCAPRQRVGGASTSPSGSAFARLFDAASVYRSMGFLVSGAPLPFVASVRYLRGPAPDSTLGLFALSLANQAITFRRAGDQFVAEYHIEAAFSNDSGVVRQVARDEQVRVRSFQETVRADESVIFQQFVTLSPGVYTVQVSLRDRNGPAVARAERVDTVPRFTGQGISRPIAIYRGEGRQQLSVLPALLANPRATLPYGADTLRFYVEGYGLPGNARLVTRVVDAGDRELWRDTVAFTGHAGVAVATVAVAPASLPVGQAELETRPAGGGDPTRTRFLVSLSSQWIVTTFDEMVSLLRYFDRLEWVDSLRKAAADRRPGVWQAFWKATDPVPITPDNEALDDYFRRVQQANLRFQGEGEPGWMTDRGEVFITLGTPDEVFDLSSGMDRSGLRAIRWTYAIHRLVLYFQDRGGFGHFRLSPASRAEYQRVLMRVRQSR